MNKFKNMTKHTLSVQNKKGKTTKSVVFWQDVKTGNLFDKKGKEVKEMVLE